MVPGGLARPERLAASGDVLGAVHDERAGIEAGSSSIKVQVGRVARQTIGQQQAGAALEDQVVAGLSRYLLGDMAHQVDVALPLRSELDLLEGSRVNVPALSRWK